MTAAKTPRKTAAAKKAEVADEPTVFEHNGVEYTVPAPLDLPVGLLEVEDEIDAIKLILGAQWDAYKASGATIRDFQDFAEKVSAAAGFGDTGN
ncbi:MULTISPECIES: hypothetical protein [Streptomyces]|uniref:hypothetical protein n=1 Tax=Streptomyces TaxID=1883 RepID=UPI001E5D889A|nr:MULTISPECIES: hypothetical protein [Streptomyces]UFQ16413.1 hypothetical protein J2N69_16170 [Streptomyces huasconensis]WCL86016.1 hypothetical protein PPN52_16175 [Streptomyces sp. JCM 35825]